MSLDLSNFTPEDLAELKAVLIGMGGLDSNGRSPIRADHERQLHDLTLPPTADDPRPTFFWSAVKPRNEAPQRPPYAHLMWEPVSGREITVRSPKDTEKFKAQGYLMTPPANAEKPDPADVVKAALAALSETDRQQVIQAAQAARLRKVQEMASALDDAALDTLMASMEPPKRGPGRPTNAERGVA